MRTLLRPAYAACFIVCGCLPMRGQVYPVPIPGGDIFKSAGGPTTFVTQFFPGLGSGFDDLNAEPNGINNFKGIVAMGYAAGTATDATGIQYKVGADIRVYRGIYIGAQPHQGAGGTAPAKAFGTFVEI